MQACSKKEAFGKIAKIESHKSLFFWEALYI